MAWPAVDKPRTAAVKNGREGLGSCWEGVGCGLSSDDNHDLNGCCARKGCGRSGTRHANLRWPPWCV